MRRARPDPPCRSRAEPKLMSLRPVALKQKEADTGTAGHSGPPRAETTRPAEVHY